MKINLAVLGAFVLSGLLLFSVALFMIGDKQQAFNHHNAFFVEMANVDGINPGSKVRVDGFDSGEVKQIQVPDKPSAKFRLKLDVIEKVHSLIRQDSVVTVESDGVVGDKFLLIHAGSDSSPEAAGGFTLRGKEPIELSAMLAKASGVMDKADTMLIKVSGVVDEAHQMLPEVHGRVDGVLESLTNTVQNANGLVTEARSGNGVVGTLLSDQETADRVKQIVGNAQQATAQLNQSSTQLGQMVADFESRNLPAKADDSLTNIRQASQQVNQISQQVGQTVTEAVGPDNTGISAGQNLRETLSNVNSATGNLSDDTEALKHNFLFRGFFKKRGYYSLAELSPQQYRESKFFQNVRNERFWLNASAFTRDTAGAVVLSEEGLRQIDQLVGGAKAYIIDRAIVVEGYSNDPKSYLQIEMSQLHAELIARYLEKQFHLNSTDIGVVVLNSTPPPSSGKTLWGGASVVLLASKK